MAHTLTLDDVRNPVQIDRAQRILDKFNELDAATQAAPVSHPAATAWLDATSYALGDIVTNSGSTYVSLQAHTSAAANDEPGAGTNEGDFWTLLTVSVGPVIVVGGAVASNVLLDLASVTPGVATVKNIGPADVTVKNSGADTMRDEDGGDITGTGFTMSGASVKQFASDGVSLWDVL